jgi:hypothetical protein
VDKKEEKMTIADQSYIMKRPTYSTLAKQKQEIFGSNNQASSVFKGLRHHSVSDRKIKPPNDTEVKKNNESQNIIKQQEHYLKINE